MANRDFKREHFENRAIGKFQSNVYDKFRKLESELTNQKNSLTNAITEAISEIPESVQGASASASGLSIVLNKTAGRPVIISFSGSEVNVNGVGYVRLKKNGNILKSYTITASSSSPSYCYMFYDSGTEKGNITYTLEYNAFSPVTLADRYLIAHEV